MLEKISTSKALANFPAMSGISTTTVSSFFFFLWARILRDMLFFLNDDKGKLSETR
jgi:hypothetical protein